MNKRPSLLYAACLRLDTLKAIGASRHQEKLRLRHDAAARGERLPTHALSTGKIHSDRTLATYRDIALRYVQWCRAHGARTLAAVDADAAWFVSAYLRERLAAGDSPSTLATIRSALRMFHRPAFEPQEREACVRALGADVALPKRRREGMTRSRVPRAMDADLAIERYHALVAFACACGLRRRELAALTVGDIHAERDGRLTIAVHHGKGGRARTVPVLPGQEHAVLDVLIGRAPEERVWDRIPVRLDVHSLRRTYAMALYTEGGRFLLPPVDGRLPLGSVDRHRALRVAHALGHNRVDVVVRHYLR